jgi:hypothetical protein
MSLQEKDTAFNNFQDNQEQHTEFTINDKQNEHNYQPSRNLTYTHYNDQPYQDQDSYRHYFLTYSRENDPL